MITGKRYDQNFAGRIVFEAVRLSIDAGEAEIWSRSPYLQGWMSRLIRDH